jgi:hypothetical protein
VQLLADDPEAGLRDLAAEPGDAHFLQEIVVLDLPALGRLDE